MTSTLLGCLRLPRGYHRTWMWSLQALHLPCRGQNPSAPRVPENEGGHGPEGGMRVAKGMARPNPKTQMSHPRAAAVGSDAQAQTGGSTPTQGSSTGCRQHHRGPGGHRCSTLCPQLITNSEPPLQQWQLQDALVDRNPLDRCWGLRKQSHFVAAGQEGRVSRYCGVLPGSLKPAHRRTMPIPIPLLLEHCPHPKLCPLLRSNPCPEAQRPILFASLWDNPREPSWLRPSPPLQDQLRLHWQPQVSFFLCPILFFHPFKSVIS